MTEKKKKKFRVNQALLAGGVAASTLGLGCTEPPEVITNPAPVERDMPSDANDNNFQDDIIVNPAPDFFDMPTDTSDVSTMDPEVSINPVPDFGTGDMASDASEDAGD